MISILQENNRAFNSYLETAQVFWMLPQIYSLLLQYTFNSANTIFYLTFKCWQICEF